MTITYIDADGVEQKLTLTESGWTGEDTELTGLINECFGDWFGRNEYFPTAWHKAKAIADKLKGSLDEPEPAFPTGDDQVA